MTSWKIKPLIVRIYDEILSGDRIHFPSATFIDSKYTALTKYLLEDILEIPLEEIPKKVKYNTFKKYQLKSHLDCYNSMFELLYDAYPVLPWKGKDIELKPYYLKKIGNNTWTNKDGSPKYNVARGAVREYVEILMDEKSWILDEMPEKITAEDFRKPLLPFGATLTSVISKVYHNAVEAIYDAFPELR